MSGRFNVAPMATRPLPSQYNTDSMHRSHPLWASAELWVKFRRQRVCRLCLSEQYSTTAHSGLGLGLGLLSVSQLFHSANNSASIPWKLVEQQLFRWNGQFHNLSTRISTTTKNLEISHFWWNMLHTTHSMFGLWSSCWELFFYENFNVLPWSGKVQEKIYTWWTQLLFCVLDNWQERQKDTQQRRATTLDANDLLFGNSAVLLCQHWGSVVRSTPHQNLLLRVKPAAAPNSQLHWECPSGAATLLSNFDSANTFFVVVLAIGNGSQGKWKSFWESEM